MNATEKITIAPHFDHFAKGYRLRESGSTPALTNSRMARYRRTGISDRRTRQLFQHNPSEQDRLRRYSKDHEYPTVGARFREVTPTIGPV